MSKNLQDATFAAGCFWGVQSAFSEIAGVADTIVGYTGGAGDNPSYEQVCSGQTGHAEAVRVRFDPDEVSYETLLQHFWACHDPTQKDRQGPDIGTQYRTAIFTHSAEQEAQAKASRAALEASGRLQRPVATQIEPAGTFWRAEEYHQHYEAKNAPIMLLRQALKMTGMEK